MYRYFVSYNFIDDNGSGFGNIDMGTQSPIDTMGQVRAIENYIKDRNNSRHVCITNWIKLDDSADPA